MRGGTSTQRGMETEALTAGAGLRPREAEVQAGPRDGHLGAAMPSQSLSCAGELRVLLLM